MSSDPQPSDPSRSRVAAHVSVTVSAGSQSFDPYRSPTLPETPYAAPSSGRPGWLTTLCVLCIVLGALGMINAAFGALGLAGGKAIQKMVQPKGANTGLPQAMQDAQDKFQNDMYAVQDKYFWLLVPTTAIRFFVALYLLVGAIRALSLKEKGRQMLLTACVVALVFEVISSIGSSFIVMENLTITNLYIEQITTSMPADKEKAVHVAKLVGTVTRAIGVVTLVLAGVVVLLKVALYIFGLVYLQKPHIQAVYQRSGSGVSAAPI
jgi:hypothetical protein